MSAYNNPISILKLYFVNTKTQRAISVIHRKKEEKKNINDYGKLTIVVNY